MRGETKKKKKKKKKKENEIRDGTIDERIGNRQRVSIGENFFAGVSLPAITRQSIEREREREREGEGEQRVADNAS